MFYKVTASDLMLCSLLVAEGSFLVAVFMSESFGLTQWLASIVAAILPLACYYMLRLEAKQTMKASKETAILVSRVTSLESDISKINLALKMRG